MEGRSNPPACIPSSFLAEFSLQHCEQTDHFAKEGNTLNEGGSEDHVCTNYVGSTRLTSNGLHCGGCEATNADTCADGGESCTNACSCDCFHKGLFYLRVKNE